MAKILDAVGPEQHISHIIVTHTHLDHSPLARALSDATSAPVLAFGAADAGRSAVMQQLAAAEQLLVDDRALIPLYYLVSRRLVSQRVIGWRDDNLTALRPARWLDLRAK